MAVSVTTLFPTTDIKTTSAVSGGEVSGDLGEYIPIVDILMKSKFQFASNSRQKVIGKVKKAVDLLKPFQLFQDSKQADTQFVLTGFTMNILEDSYTMEVTEYDNTTPINLT
jgi:hypothetical protein